MAQQTRMDVVVPYFTRFVARFPTIEALASATEDDVVAHWSGLGYYRRARMLHQSAKDVIRRFGGSLPRGVDELMTIGGIGRYTAGAIASIAFDERAPIVDGNVARVLARLYGEEDPWRFAEQLVNACTSPRMLNQGLMEIGALICTPRNADCAACPLRKTCVAYATNRVDELPAKKKKVATRAVTIALYLMTDRKGRILMQRKNTLFHLPQGSRKRGRPIGKFRHTITTRRITFEVFVSPRGAAAPGGDYRWIDPNDLSSIPHPSYVAKALRLARNTIRESAL